MFIFAGTCGGRGGGGDDAYAGLKSSLLQTLLLQSSRYPGGQNF